MRSLKILIWIPEKPGDLLNQMIVALSLNYGVRNIDIAGVGGEYKLSLEGRDLPNIAPNKLPEVAFDYVIVAGEAESGSSKKSFADKLGVPAEQIVFDFELCNGTFAFPKQI